jgi:trimeric autotransporter adhesin
MKSLLFAFITCIICLAGYSQSISINTDGSLPNASALLDVKSSTKGILIPRTSSASRIAIINPARGLMLYDTTTSGFWFYNGSAWTQFSDGTNVWNIAGNAITNPATNFIGSTNNQPLRFRVNNAWAGEIHPTSNNVFFGLNAGKANTDGVINTGTGDHSLFSNTDGSYNTAYGSSALLSNTHGSTNTALGVYALALNSTGSSNTAAGTDALNSNTAGNENTAYGYRALYSSKDISQNTAIGSKALYFNTSGYYNTATGYQALYSNTRGYYNTANGYHALYSDTSGSFNTASGVETLYSNTSGSDNTAYGGHALSSNTTGSVNTASGESALASNLTGNNNTGDGFNALFFNNTGSNNTAIGYNALAYNRGGNSNIAIGYGSGTANYAQNVYNTISIGNDDYLNGYQNQAFIGNTSMVWIGGNVTWSTFSDARIKNTVAEDVKGLDFILRLRPVTYHISNKAISTVTGNKQTPDFAGKYDREKVKYTGFVAQEVELAAKASGYDFSGYTAPKNQWGLYTISYEQFVVPLVKGMQEQQTIIEELKKQLVEMKVEMELLKKKN